MPNEKRLIDSGKLIRDLNGIKDMLVAAGDPFLASVMNRAIGCVENQKVVDVAPLRHGRWIPVGKLSIGGINDYMQFYKCSSCEDGDFTKSRYCPHCGARMDLEDKQ